MQFFDVNCMIGDWIYQPLRFKEKHELKAEMKRLNISRAWVFHSQSWLCDIKTGNDSIIEAVRDEESLIPVVALSPLIRQEFGGDQALGMFLKKNRVGAVRLFPSDHNYLLNPWNVEKLFTLLNELHMPVLIEGNELTGGISQYFPHLNELAGQYPKVNFIMLTVGYRGSRTLYQLMEKHPNIYLDTSTFITYRGIEDVVKYFGPERILFGTRMPFIDGGVSVGRVIYADISPKAKEMIARGSLSRILEGNVCLNSMEGGRRQ